MPPAVSVNRKLEFFYIGKRNGIIDTLLKCFEGGYAAENTDRARAMMQRLSTTLNAAPAVIIIEAALGYNAISSFL